MELKLDWSKETVHTDGRFISTANPTPEFWYVWREKKEAVKKAGYSVRKVNDQWTVTRFRDNDKAINDSNAEDSDINIPVPSGLEYRPFQKAGIAYAIQRPASCIADEMGLGKTIQAIGVINATTPETVLVICPCSLKINWKRELEKWLVSERDIQIVNGGGEKIPANPDVVIINYDVLKKHSKDLHSRKWGLVILDEAHYIKSPKAQRSIAITGKYSKKEKKVVGRLEADRKIALTGTPIPNRPIELQPIAGYLLPEVFGNYFSFAQKFAGAYKDRFGWHFDGATNLEELQRLLRQSIMVRRKKDQVLKDLPEKTRQIIVLPNDKYTNSITREFESLAEASANISAEDIDFEKMSNVRHETALQKVQDVVDHVASIPHKVVVMAHHRDVVEGIKDGLQKAGKQVVTLTGSNTQEQRDSAVNEFQNGNAEIFVGTIGAAGTGLTLHAASHVVFAELSWVSGDVLQAEDRCHRMGQRNSVLVQHLVVDGTIDARLAKVIVKKMNIQNESLDDVIVNEEIKIEDIAIDVTGPKLSKQPKPLATEVVKSLQSFVQAVATRCDGVKAKDGQGFNKIDATFGYSLSQQKTWSPAQQHAAKVILRKYKRQILEAGLEAEYLKIYS